MHWKKKWFPICKQKNKGLYVYFREVFMIGNRKEIIFSILKSFKYCAFYWQSEKLNLHLD